MPRAAGPVRLEAVTPSGAPNKQSHLRPGRQARRRGASPNVEPPRECNWQFRFRSLRHHLRTDSWPMPGGLVGLDVSAQLVSPGSPAEVPELKRKRNHGARMAHIGSAAHLAPSAVLAVNSPVAVHRARASLRQQGCHAGPSPPLAGDFAQVPGCVDFPFLSGIRLPGRLPRSRRSAPTGRLELPTP
jgi:hypothetical protein